jgi:hypothetical protein
MGFKKSLDVNDVKLQLLQAHSEISSSYNDGFTQWEIKKELYEIKWLLDEILRRQPTFSEETEWLNEQEMKRMWSELKR